jgi:CheY-like chemotaxis protein
MWTAPFKSWVRQVCLKDATSMATTATAAFVCDDSDDQHGYAHKCRILVIDDVPDAADTMRMLLEFYGHEVRIAYTGTAAIMLARQFRPEVVLCDIRMPNVCGYDVAQALRDDPATAGARLIATTGITSEADLEKCRKAGFERHMVKPIDVEELRELVAAWADESAHASVARMTR